MPDWLGGNSVMLSSTDSLTNANDILRLNVEYLNTLVPNRIPRHKLFLKPEMSLMLLRNIILEKAYKMEQLLRSTTDNYNVPCLEQDGWY